MLPPPCSPAFPQEGQHDGKGGTFPLAAAYLDPAMVTLHDLLGDMQADAKPWIAFSLGIGDLIEPLEDVLLVDFVNTNPKILHTHQGVSVLA